jgi:hypothetical protein
MLSLLMPPEVSRNFMMSLLDDEMEAERLFQSLSLRLKQNALSIACKAFYHQTCEKNFFYLALLAMRHYHRAFQNTVS